MSAGPTEPGRVPGPKVFITYRRGETAAHAGRLYDAMVTRFGEGNVFMDVDMAPGVDFVERITQAVAACQVMLVVMGPTWATVADEQGNARIADPEDFVRLEVETALQRPDVTPIPVLVSGARMPSREDLPPGVQAITRRNALELSDQRWRSDIGRLIHTLDELLAETPRGSRGLRWSRVRRSGIPGRDAALGTKSPEESSSATTTSVETKPAASPTGVARRLRRPLVAAIAIAAMAITAIVIAAYLLRPQTATTTVPVLVGVRTLVEAQTTLEAAGLTLGNLTQRPTNEARPGTILRQSPPPGKEVDQDSVVSVEVAVANDKAKARVPSVIARTPAEAANILSRAGFTLAPPTKLPRKTDVVATQIPEAGTVADKTTPVTLVFVALHSR